MRIRPLPIAAAVAVAVVAFVGVGFTRQAIEHRRACPGPDLPVRPTATAALPPAATTGRLLIAHDGRGDASVLDLATGDVAYIRLGFTDPHESAVSPDGRWGMVSDFGDRKDGKFQGHRVAVIDMRARRVRHVIELLPSRGAHGVAFVPGGDGLALVTAQSTREVVMLDAPRGRVVARMASGADGSHLLAVAPDGRHAFTANEGDGSVSRFDLRARRLDRRFPVAPTRAEGIALSADGAELLVGGTDPGVVYVVNPGSGNVIGRIAEGFRVTNRIVAPPGSRALVVDVGCVHVVDRAGRRRDGSLNAQGGSLAVSPDGTIAFLPGDGAYVDVVDITRRERIRRIALPARPHGLSWAPATSAAATAGATAGATGPGARPSP